MTIVKKTVETTCEGLKIGIKYDGNEYRAYAKGEINGKGVNIEKRWRRERRLSVLAYIVDGINRELIHEHHTPIHTSKLDRRFMDLFYVLSKDRFD
jgi:hypothetical protein